MSDHIWDTFDSLFRTVYRHGRRVEELEARIALLERRLAERAAGQPARAGEAAEELPLERAA